MATGPAGSQVAAANGLFNAAPVVRSTRRNRPQGVKVSGEPTRLLRQGDRIRSGVER
jgi:hypothetical protein